MSSVVLASFGGPRSLEEVEPFLKCLLCDQDVLQTPLPALVHKALFNRVAKKRAHTTREDYAHIGGKSPIFEDTESLAKLLSLELNLPVHAFYRYLPSTHARFFEQLQASTGPALVFPLFPQFTYATTGSVARCFYQKGGARLRGRLNWVASYADHPLFVGAWQRHLAAFMHAHGLGESQCLLLFSAHGVPKRYVQEGDPYQRECFLSFHAIRSAFPQAASVLCYQSQFGKAEWIRPYTADLCRGIPEMQGKTTLFIPISFTSDHVETLFEIEGYVQQARAAGLQALRVPCLNLRPDWITAIADIIRGSRALQPTESLIRKKRQPFVSHRNVTARSDDKMVAYGNAEQAARLY